MSICLSVCLAVCLCKRVSFHLLSVRLSFCLLDSRLLDRCLSVYLFLCPSTCPSASQCICLIVLVRCPSDSVFCLLLNVTCICLPIWLLPFFSRSLSLSLLLLLVCLDVLVCLSGLVLPSAFLSVSLGLCLSPYSSVSCNVC